MYKVDDRGQREAVLPLLDDPLYHAAAVAEFGHKQVVEWKCSRINAYEIEKVIREQDERAAYYQSQRQPGTKTMTSATVIQFPNIVGMQQAFSLDNLTQYDRDTIAEYILDNIELEKNSEEIEEGLTDNLERMMDAARLTPIALYTILSSVTDIHLMIAAAALRSVTRLPDDPRLNPQPYPAAPVKLPRTPQERARVSRAEKLTGVKAGGYIASVAPNPKRRGSASFDRYAHYAVGLSRNEVLSLGLTSADLKYDTEHQYITWVDEKPEASE